jgi:hypothetical protein
MAHQRETAGREVALLPRHLGSQLGYDGAEDVGKVDPGLLEDASLVQDACSSAPSGWTLPGVFAKTFRTVDVLQGGTKTVLQRLEIIGDHGTHEGCPWDKDEAIPGMNTKPV